MPKWAVDLCGEWPFRQALLRRYTVEQLPHGAIVALVRLVDVIPTNAAIGERGLISAQEAAFGDYGPGRYAWLFEEIHQLPEPIPCQGTQGLWHTDAVTDWSDRGLADLRPRIAELKAAAVALKDAAMAAEATELGNRVEQAEALQRFLRRLSA